jgi:DNA-binding GntR family transcriptional regulator
MSHGRSVAIAWRQIGQLYTPSIESDISTATLYPVPYRARSGVEIERGAEYAVTETTLMDALVDSVERQIIEPSTEVQRPERAMRLRLQPLNATSLRDQAYTLLKNAITDADIYNPAHELRLDERQLMQALGVSRTPVREALSILEQEGFLRTVPRRGIFIVRKTRRQIVEMVQVWAALESMAARLATLHAPDAEIAKLRHLFDEFESSPPSEHLNEYSDVNIAFHQAVIRLGGSQLIEDATRNLFLHVRAIRRATITQSDRATRSIIDHLKIVEALERRDTELAERLSRQHALDLASHVDRYCDFLE